MVNKVEKDLGFKLPKKIKLENWTFLDCTDRLRFAELQ